MNTRTDSPPLERTTIGFCILRCMDDGRASGCQSMVSGFFIPMPIYLYASGLVAHEDGRFNALPMHALISIRSVGGQTSCMNTKEFDLFIAR